MVNAVGSTRIEKIEEERKKRMQKALVTKDLWA
jgi:hypothetical protein